MLEGVTADGVLVQAEPRSSSSSSDGSGGSVGGSDGVFEVVAARTDRPEANVGVVLIVEVAPPVSSHPFFF